MLVMGVCNPQGEDNSYNGLYYTKQELQDMVDSGTLQGLPLKTEHEGASIGNVVSGFIGQDGALRCLVRVDEDNVLGAIVGNLVRKGVAQDFSLGYSVDVKQSSNTLKAGKKSLLEISLVRRGARQGCHLSMYEEDDGRNFVRTRPSDWDSFGVSLNDN